MKVEETSEVSPVNLIQMPMASLHAPGHCPALEPCLLKQLDPFQGKPTEDFDSFDPQSYLL